MEGLRLGNQRQHHAFDDTSAIQQHTSERHAYGGRGSWNLESPNRSCPNAHFSQIQTSPVHEASPVEEASPVNEASPVKEASPVPGASLAHEASPV